MLMPFHFAYHVTDLDQARAFYGGVLGCTEGRSTDTWVDFDFFGHQISLHLGTPFANAPTGKVGDHMVPMPHFGLGAGCRALPRAGGQAWRRRCRIRHPADPAFCRATGASNGPCSSATHLATPIEVKGYASADQVFAS